MIILDTSILRTFSPESSSADLLRAIRRLDAERVAAPWMVLEELTAQQAIKYRDKYDKAAQALQALKQITPWGFEVPLPPCEADEFTRHWRDKWTTIVEELETSDAATRQALLREANNLPPCKTVKDFKTGSRDAAIWLSAVEYARENPHETVYFVSSNTNDFGKGAPYPAPMNEDLAGLEARFVHLTTMDEVLAEFAKLTTTEEAHAAAVLASESALDAILQASHEPLGLTMDGSFPCTIGTGLAGETMIVPAVGWTTTKVQFDEVESVQTYRIGEEEWCLAVVRWNLGGVMIPDLRPGVAWGGCSWTTSVLFTLDEAEPRLAILRAETPAPISNDAFEALRMPSSAPTSLERAIRDVTLAALWDRADRLRATSDGAEQLALWRRIGQQMRMGDTSAG